MSEHNKLHRITQKLVIKGTLTLASPLVMGKGTGDWVDKAIMRLPDGRPYIPASAFTGSLKNAMELLGIYEKNKEEKWEWLWGSERGGQSKRNREDVYQSHLLVYDLIPTSVASNKISYRDGIKINEQSGIVEEGAKYDYEILEPGVSFPLTIEITVRKKFMNKVDFKSLVSSIIATICHHSFRVGAFTAQGFGRFEVKFDNKERNLEAFLFDFTERNTKRKQHEDAWFEYVETGICNADVPFPIEPSDLPQVQFPAFQINAIFRLKSALMIGASGGEKSKADKTSIQSNGNYVIPGKSIRGAIRHRARRILKIWEDQGIQIRNGDEDDLTSELFGFVKQDGSNKSNAGRGLIRLEETTIPKDAVVPMLQNRIRIDRFTGGVIDGALFNSEPVWTTENEDLQITLTVDTFKGLNESSQKLYKKLLLMLLKDLWTGDLAIGGEKSVGRGVMQGKKAEIINDNIVVASFTWADDGKTAEALNWQEGTPEAINELVAV